MTNSDELGQHFESEFKDWEKNRMYPPTQRISSMKPLNDQHLMALARAKHFVQSGITGNMSPKMRDSIERDIFLIEQVHTYVRQQMKEPGLPMSPEPIDVGEIHKNNADKILEIGADIGTPNS